ncbi:MAG: M60 family metallopeptidase [Verrucomicrobiota bacterium]
MQRIPLISSFLSVAIGFATTVASRADRDADYAAITNGQQGQVITAPGSPGTVAQFGTAAFPVLLGTAVPVQAVMSAGRYGESYAAGAARAMASSHTGFFDASGSARSLLFSNSVLWASKQAAPVGTMVAIANSAVSSSFISGLGYTTTSVSSSLTAANLAGVHVLILSAHTSFTASAVTNIKNFAAAGGGIVITSTPWALNTQQLTDANSILDPFGLVFNTDDTADATWTVSATTPDVIQSALAAADALIADKEGTAVMTAANRTIAANSIFQVTQMRIDIPALAAKLDILGNAGHYGVIAPTAAAPLVTTTKPVEKMLARYQSQTFDVLTPAQLFVHPCAADFPGLPTPGAPTVSKTITVNGNTPVDFYVNSGGDPTRFETGLYAAPGATITVTIPAGLTAQGLQVHIAGNGSEDSTWNGGNSGTWTFFPKLWRRVALTQAATQTGHVLGGLVTILVPPGKTLGNFNVTVDGALEAPAFVLGQTSDAQWNAGIKNSPAPYGYIQNEKLTIYLPKNQLAAMSNPTEVTTYWKQVMDTADEYYGYTTYRKRGEVIATSRYVSAGGAYAGYPIEAGWGTNVEHLLNTAVAQGSWGDFHELGHGYQNNFDNAFVIANSAEVDVNLFPGMIYTLIHDRTSWDGAHSTYDATSRLPARNTFLALPAAERTWQKAHDTFPVAYDFYFNLAEAFGWDAYKTALGRLMRYLQTPTAATDAALNALSTSDPNFKRNRFYILFCDATGRNLDAYFQTYGLGVTGLGTDITASAKTHISAKGYPVWNGNTAVDSITDPGALAVSEDAAAGTVVGDLTAIDADEPGTIWEWSITSGNANGAFTIDRRTGEVKTTGNGLDRETAASHTLGILVQDNGVPRFTATRSITVNVSNVVEPPMAGTTGVLNATSAMSAGTVLGQGILADVSRTFVTTSILSGNSSGAFAIDATGQIILQNPAGLPATSLVTLSVTGTDSGGFSITTTIRVLANATPGLRELRWAGTGNFTGNTWSSATNYTGNVTSADAAQNAADSYSRRLLGWIIPPVTGQYTFWISSADGSRFYLGTDTTEVTKSLLCSVASSTGYQAFDSQPLQVSAPVTLEAGKFYWFEAQQGEASGTDHLSVAWQGAGIATRTIVAGAYLVPNQAGINVSNDPVGSPDRNGTWSTTASGSWTTPGNWIDGAVANGANRTADFSTLNLIADAIVTLDGARTIGNLTFDDITPSNNWTLNSGSGGPLTLDLPTGVPNILVTSGTATLNVVLAGNKGLAKTGGGSLTLGGANLYSGTTTISNPGETTGIIVANASALGTGPVVVNGAQNFSHSVSVNTGLTVNNALTLKRGAGGSNRAILGLAASSTWAGNITVDNANAAGIAAIGGNGGSASAASIVSGNIGFSTLGTPSAASPTFVLRSNYGKVSGSISLSTGYLQLLDVCKWEFSNATNTWGTLDIAHDSAIVTVGAANTLSPTGVVYSNSTNGGTLNLNNQAGNAAYSQTIAGLSGKVKVGLLTGAATLTLNTTANQASSGVISGAISLVKSGSATQTLTGSNNYAGATTVTAGTLSLSAATLANASTVTIASGAALDLTHGATDIIDKLFINGVQQAAGLYKSATGIGTGTVLAALTSTGKLQVTTSPPVTFASWMGTFDFSAYPAADLTPKGDADLDGISNVIEHIFGTAPNAPTPGLTQIGATAPTLTFKHRLNPAIASNVTYSYQWSSDLNEWKNSGESNVGGTTVAISAGAPVSGVVTVTAVIGTGPAAQLFVRLVAYRTP